VFSTESSRQQNARFDFSAVFTRLGSSVRVATVYDIAVTFEARNFVAASTG
jgi:hypothetical protein